MKKALVSAVVAVVIALILSGCATIKVTDNYKMLSGNIPTVVIMGGAGSTEKQLDPLHQALKNSVVVIPDKYYPLSGAAKVVREQIIKKGITGPVILVGWSWGPLIAHQMNSMYKGLVVAIVAIASPLDIKFVPSGIGAPFIPDGDGPLYVIAGAKPGVPQKWYMTTDESDGVVDCEMAKGFGKRDLKGFAVIRGENAGHEDIIQNPEAIKQVVEWLTPFIASK